MSKLNHDLFSILTEDTVIDVTALWEAVTVFDLLIFFLTVAKTYSMWRSHRNANQENLYALLFRHGEYLY